MRLFASFSRFSLIMVVAFQLCCLSEASAGVKENIGGGGSSNTSTSSGSKSSTKTIIYVLGGAAVAFVAWKYFSEKEDSEEQDSLQAVILKPLHDFNNSLTGQVQILEQKMPVNIDLDLNSTIYNDRKFLFGVKFKL